MGSPRAWSLIRVGPRAALALALAGCAGPPPPPPTAVMDLVPATVCLGDDFATPIVLSGRRSAEALSLVPAPASPEAELRYRWSLEGAEHVLVRGGLDAVELEVVTAGDRPLHVSLTVETEDGGRATTLRSLGVTLPLAPPCGEGCPEGTECVDGACLPEGSCEADEDCPSCFECRNARCQPPEGRP